jgi:glutamine---fructose-6-phosphate transaminase (isomerizing)
MTATAAVGGELMAADIAEQPAVLRGLLANADAVAAVAERIGRYAPRCVMFAGRGTSDHAALYGKYLAEIRMRLPAGLASPSSFTVYRARPDLRETLFLAVSQSGGSPDLVESVAAARSAGALTVAVTNNAESELAGVAGEHVDVRAGTERAVAATKTYTAELLALYLLLGGADAAARAAAVPDAVERTLALADVPAAATRLATASRLVTTARGYSYATAREAALKLMETSYVSAHAFSGADLLHGPLAMIDERVPVLAITTPGRGATALAPVLRRLDDAGADVLLVGDARGLPVVLDGVVEELAPVVEIGPLQQLARLLALGRGADPDRPRGLTKVTTTW